MIARIRAAYARFNESHPEAASIVRHAVFTFAGAFSVLVLPVVDDILNGGPVDEKALFAAIAAGAAAGLRAVGLWLRSYLRGEGNDA